MTALWNLDRIDQRQLPLNSTFAYGTTTSAGTGRSDDCNSMCGWLRATLHQSIALGRNPASSTTSSHCPTTLSCAPPPSCCPVLWHATSGKGVTIYVLDSGIRASHQEFQPWDSSAGSRRVTVGPDFVDGDGQADDCDGHGSHVSSTGAVATVTKHAST